MQVQILSFENKVHATLLVLSENMNSFEAILAKSYSMLDKEQLLGLKYPNFQDRSPIFSNGKIISAILYSYQTHL